MEEAGSDLKNLLVQDALRQPQPREQWSKVYT